MQYAVSIVLPFASVKEIMVLLGVTRILQIGKSANGTPLNNSVGVDESGKNLCFLQLK